MKKTKLFCPFALSTLIISSVCFPLTSCQDKEEADIYNVHVIGSKNITVTVTQNKKGENLIANIDVADGYSIEKLTITAGTTKLVDGEDYQFADNRLEVWASAIDDDVTIEVTDNEQPTADPYNVAIIGCQSIVVTIVENQKGSDLLMTFDVTSPHYLTGIIIQADGVTLGESDYTYTPNLNLLRIYASSIANADRITVQPLDEQSPTIESYNLVVSGGSSFSSVRVVQNQKGQDIVLDIDVPGGVGATVSNWVVVVGSTTLGQSDYSITISTSSSVIEYELTIPAELLADANDISVSFVATISEPSPLIPIYYDMTSNCETYETVVNQEGQDIALTIEVYDINLLNNVFLYTIDQHGNTIKELVSGTDYDINEETSFPGTARTPIDIVVDKDSVSNAYALCVADKIKTFPHFWDYGSHLYKSWYPQATQLVPMYPTSSILGTYFMRCVDSDMGILCDDMLYYGECNFGSDAEDGDIIQMYIDPSRTTSEDTYYHNLDLSFSFLHLTPNSGTSGTEYTLYEKVSFDMKVEYNVYENDLTSTVPFNWIVAPVFYYIFSTTPGTDQDKITAVYNYLANTETDWSFQGEYSYVSIDNQLITLRLDHYTKANLNDFIQDIESISALEQISDFTLFGSNFLDNLSED